jgi:hypothetical protein
MKTEPINPITPPITDLSIEEDGVLTEGIGSDYAWYQAKVLANKISSLNFAVQQVITTLEDRRKDNLRVIGELLRENVELKNKLREKNSA